MESTRQRKKTGAEIPSNNLLTRSKNLPPARRGAVEESLHFAFPRPPVYRSPSFPVFFYPGNRKYKKEMSSSGYVKDELRQIVTPGPDVRRLGRVIYTIADELQERLREDDPISFICAEPTPPIPYVILLRSWNNIRIACSLLPYLLHILFHHLLHHLNIFMRNDGSNQRALEELEQQIVSQPTRPHLQLSSDPGWSQRGSSCLPRSHSVPSLSQISCAENKTFRPSQSLPDMLLNSSFEEFTPDITADDNDESYRFLCSCPGLYQCSVTGLVFHMEGEGDVVYRIVSWDRRLLAQHHKKPAGPLFDITCLQQSVCRLHLPHCEIPSTAGCPFLSVAHLNDEGIEFIPPHRITETHVIINISGFSGYGNVTDEASPLVPIQALVLLFYRPLNELTSFLNVLMLPGNVVLRDVRRTRKSLVGDELYIETSSHCKLLPGQEYTLSTCPEDDSVLVQPKEAEFHCGNYNNYIPSFQVRFKTVMLNMKVFLRDTNSSQIVWQREVCLPSAGLQRLCLQGSSVQILFDIRSSFIEGISGPVLKSLLDKLFEKKVLTDSERESADEIQSRGDKARFVIDTVRMKGEAASSEMIEFLCEVDPFLCKHLGLI